MILVQKDEILIKDIYEIIQSGDHFGKNVVKYIHSIFLSFFFHRMHATL